MKKILVFSNYLPNEGWGGGVIIRSLISNHKEDINFFWVSLNSKEEEIIHNINVLNFKIKYFRGRGKFSFIRLLETKLFSHNLKRLIFNYKIDKLWIILGTSYQDLYKINSISKGIAIPIHISIHDDPIIEIELSKQKKAKYFFSQILKNASTIDVISSRMKEYYKKEYNVDSVVITRCIDENFPLNEELEIGTLNIVMGGFGNASSPWPIPLMKSIDLLNEKNKTNLHLFDNKLKNYTNENIFVYDLMSEEEYNRFLKKINIGYACDDLLKTDFSQFSLPTKIITYIGAGIPFVYHGPTNSTVGDLILKIEMGIIVDSNSANELFNAFYKIYNNYNFYRDNCLLARKTIFSKKEIQSLFYRHILN